MVLVALLTHLMILGYGFYLGAKADERLQNAHITEGYSEQIEEKLEEVHKEVLLYEAGF